MIYPVDSVIHFWNNRDILFYIIFTSYPTRANGIIVLVNSQTGFCRRFLFPGLKLKTSCGKFLNLAHYFPCDVKLRLSAHSRSFLANQKARNAIVGAENLLWSSESIFRTFQFFSKALIPPASDLPHGCIVRYCFISFLKPVSVKRRLQTVDRG